MKLSRNTILITGGASGIGRGLAEALHQRKNQVIIAGRRKNRLREVAKANPGMAWIELNIEDLASISAVATKLTAEYPKLNVLKRQTEATVINTTSVLGFVPLAVTAVYSSTKAAMHSYTMSLRYKLKDTRVRVLELAPPWVQTDLLGSNNEPRAMPLAEFIEETMRFLGTDADEVLVESAKPLRNNAGPHEAALVTQFNDAF
jgi:uncharacterized oxidoreductase